MLEIFGDSGRLNGVAEEDNKGDEGGLNDGPRSPIKICLVKERESTNQLMYASRNTVFPRALVIAAIQSSCSFNVSLAVSMHSWQNAELAGFSGTILL